MAASSSIDALVRAGTLERVPNDSIAAGLWVEQAARHLEAATRILDVDLVGAYSLLYDAARKSIAALMLAEGLRARATPGAHRAVGTFVEARLGAGAFGDDVRRFDAMRRNRNRSEYGVRHFGAAEVDRDLAHARRIHEAVRTQLQ